MDLNDLKNTVAGLTLYDIKAGFRKAQNAVMNYTEMEAKVREATNNEPWGASSTLMQEIANGTFSYQTLNEIMPMIYRRFTEKSAEEWRQIYKSLQLLEFLIKHGSERVIDDARGHITLLKMLRQFHFIDLNGKDQGINVRNRAKELAELLSDVERIRAERKKARATKNKYTGVEGGSTFGGGFSGSSSGGRYGGFGSDDYGSGGSAQFGGYSGGVYGDGGGFGGQQASDFRDTQARSDKFEEYDEFDEADRPAASSSRATRASERSSKKAAAAASSSSSASATAAAKKREPEVDLFSFDEPSSSAAPALASNSGLADLAAPSGAAASAANNDDDEFDDFQEASPATQPSSSGFAAALPPPPLSSQIAAPKPLSAPQQAGLAQMVNLSSISPMSSSTSTPTTAAKYSAFNAPIPAAAQAPKPTGYQPSGPNYYGTVQAQGSINTASSTPRMTPGLPSASAGIQAGSNNNNINSSGGKPSASGGGDAFGALWGKASVNIKRTSTPAAGPAMGQLAKEKSSAGIWGAPASQMSAGSGAGGSGSGSGDLLG